MHHTDTTANSGPMLQVHLTPRAVAAGVAICLACAHGEARADAGALEEIVVTAARRAQSTLDVPYNISALSADRLESNGITDVADLMRSIPGLASYDRGPGGNGSNTRIIIRGLNVDGSGTSELRQVTVSPVSVYVDETPIFVNLHLSDIERVEVLRGPQGTLYGSGALGGTVRFLHRKPDLDAFSARVDIQSGWTSHAGDPNYGIEGVFNFPLSPTVALRTNAGYTADAGFIDLTRFELGPDLLGVSDGAGGVETTRVRDINDSSTLFARFAARFRPSDTFTLDASYHYQRDEADGRQAQGRILAPRSLFSPIEEPVRRSVDLFALEMQLDLGPASLTSSSSYVRNRGRAIANFTPFTFPNYEAFGFVFDPTQYSVADFRNRDRLFAQELRLVSAGDGPFDWVVGGYYLHHKTAEVETETLVGLTTFFAADGFLTDQIVDFGRSARIKDRALFGELTWHATNRLHLTGGLRWFDISVDANQYYRDPSSLSDFSGVPTSYGDQDTILKLNLSYDLNDDLMAYATWSQGYRRGGANSLPTTEPPDIQNFVPDKVDNYELGIKGTVNRRLQFSAAAYYIDWKDVQIATFSPVNFLDAAINGGDASSYGLELEVTASPSDNSVVSLAYAYTNAKLKEAFSVANGNFVALDGARLPGTPEHMFAGAVDITQPLAAGKLTYHVDATYTSRTVNEVSLQPLVGEYREFGGFMTLGARISFETARWKFGLFGENLTDSKGVTAQSALVWIPEQAFEWLQRPRTFGVFASVEF